MPLTHADDRAVWLAYCFGRLTDAAWPARRLCHLRLAAAGPDGGVRLTASGHALAEQMVAGPEPEDARCP